MASTWRWITVSLAIGAVAGVGGWFLADAHYRETYAKTPRVWCSPCVTGAQPQVNDGTR